MKTVFGIILVTTQLISISFAKTKKYPCHHRWLTVELGSGTSKFQIADVYLPGPTCLGKKEVKQFFRFPRKLVWNRFVHQFRVNLEQNGRSFTPGFMKEGGAKLDKYLRYYQKKFGPDRISVFGTSAFRLAFNFKFAGPKAETNKALFSRWMMPVLEKHGAKFKVLTKKEETKMSFLSGAGLDNPNNLVVWDMGASSIRLGQLVQRPTEKRKLMYLHYERWGSVWAQKLILKLKADRRQPSKKVNPVSGMIANDFINWVVRKLKGKRPETSFSKFTYLDNSKGKRKRFIAVGELFYYNSCSIIYPNKKRFIGCRFTRKQLRRAIFSRLIGRSFPRKGPFTSEKVSSPLLILALMQALDIPYVEVRAPSLNRGLVFHQLKNYHPYSP